MAQIIWLSNIAFKTTFKTKSDQPLINLQIVKKILIKNHFAEIIEIA